MSDRPYPCDTPETIGHFSIAADAAGVATVIFSRPPVNAISVAVYEDLGRLCDRLETDPAIRAVVLTAPDDARAWCGGADLNDFVGMDAAARKARYAYINEQLPRFYRLERPVVAAINGPAIGVGLILAALCDMRVADENARISCPEIAYGLVAGSAGLMRMLNMPEAKAREMLFTGAQFPARELERSGFFNYVVPRDQVLACAVSLARQIATKSLRAIRARKIACTRLDEDSWLQAYLDAQALSAELTDGRDGAEGVQAFLDKRPPAYRHE